MILGFPFDEGWKDFDEGFGEYLGPHSLWRFLGRCGVIKNLEWGIILDNIKVSDYGNINPKDANGNEFDTSTNLSFKYTKLQSKVKLLC